MLTAQSLPLPRPRTAFLRGICVVQKSTKLERVPGSLVDVFEAIGSQVNPAKVARHDYQHVIYFLQTRVKDP